MKKMKLLVINPGSTSTKLSLFADDEVIFDEDIFHDAPLLLKYPTVNDQVPFRKEVISQLMEKHGYRYEDIDAFIGRGGSAYPCQSGVMEVDERLYQDTVNAVGGSEHPAKLGVMIAYQLAKEYHKPVFTLNPTNVDELQDVARVTGIAGVYRNAQSHVLNQKAIARYHSELNGKKYEECNYIVCHIDGGITVNAHCHGRMIDGNVGSGGDGAFTVTRIGSIPVLPLLDYLETHSLAEVRTMCSRSGGMVSHFGTSNANAIHEMVEKGDEKAVLLWNAMIYQITKQIGAMAAVLKGEVDAILLTGGLVRFSDIVEGIKESCEWIAPVYLYPGEREQIEMAQQVLKVMRKETAARKYTGKPVWQGFEFDR